MKTLKFGGTSLETAEKFLQVSSIIINNFKKKEISVVLSAPANITNYLNNSIKEIKNKKKTIEEIINNIDIIITNLLKKIFLLEKKFQYKKIKKIIDIKIQDLSIYLKKIKLMNFDSDKKKAKIISLGEIFSVNIMKILLNTKGYRVTILNPIKNLISSGPILNAIINLEKSKKNISKINFPKNSIILMPGFISGNEQGKLVILGRNGSDYSAAALSTCLSSNVCEIWTDVDGIYTCDPRKIKNPILLKEITYQEATELSYFGAKVIHPKTIYPLEKNSIPCIIKNTNHPEKTGTLIKKNIQSQNNPITGITYLKKIVLIKIIISNSKKQEYYIKKINNFIFIYNITVIFLNFFSLENQIHLCIKSKFLKQINKKFIEYFKTELKDKFIKSIKTKENLALITLVGNEIKNFNSKILEKFLKTIKILNNKIYSIDYNISNIRTSFVIYNKNISYFLQRIHKFLFSEYKELNIFLIGLGGIGKSLLKKIFKQKNYLNKKKIKFNIQCIANSKKILKKSKYIKIENWENYFDKSKKEFHLKNILKIPKKKGLINSVLIDCTASKKFIKYYPKIIKNKFHIVSANKKSNTSSYKEYKNIRKLTQKYNKKFLYETHIGAGLPVINNLQNLIHSGDQLIKFEGILSGSMSFIFGKLDEQILLSEATKEAQKLGFTEPHPKDDLSGKDVARKLLILAREFGFNLELSDIVIEKILPKYFNEINNQKNFWIELKKIDLIFKKYVHEAKKKNQVIRFVGIIEKNGKCNIKICNVDKSNPLYYVKNGENVLVFYTKYYSPIPLIIRGYGAGNNVTTSGIFSDLLHILR